MSYLRWRFGRMWKGKGKDLEKWERQETVPCSHNSEWESSPLLSPFSPAFSFSLLLFRQLHTAEVLQNPLVTGDLSHSSIGVLSESEALPFALARASGGGLCEVPSQDFLPGTCTLGIDDLA